MEAYDESTLEYSPTHEAGKLEKETVVDICKIDQDDNVLLLALCSGISMTKTGIDNAS
jgi:hypothetical protein